ncbi:MAG: hypothetical protein ACREDW_05730 [Aestuariivirgaceae bacterium]
MSTQTSPETDHGFDFAAIEATVKETERGRWFLAEYDKRGRIAETQALLAAIRKLEEIIAAGPERVSAPSLSLSVGTIIAEARNEISSIRAQLVPDDCTQKANCDVFAALTIDAKIIAVELAHLAEVLQAAEASELPHLSARLSTLARSHDTLTRQIATVSNLLLGLKRGMDDDGAAEPASVADRLEPLLAEVARPQEASLSEENLRYFGKDEELFGAEERHPTPVHGVAAPAIDDAVSVQSGRNRIVIVRTSPAEARPIPLVEEGASELSQPAA